jgi:hypothetical protein
MAYEMKPDTGSLFKNDRREKDTHANARGSALIGGVEYWVDAWTNETQSGDKYQSLKFKRKDAAQPHPTQQPAAFDTDLSDDVPF